MRQPRHSNLNIAYYWERFRAPNAEQAASFILRYPVISVGCFYTQPVLCFLALAAKLKFAGRIPLVP